MDEKRMTYKKKQFLVKIAISGEKLWQDEWIELKLWVALKQQPVVNIIEVGLIIIFIVL